MDLRDRPEDEAFRKEIQGWLADHLVGDYAELGGRGGSGDEGFGFEVRLRWERELAEGGWTCVGWPVEHGGRGASVAQQVVFNEEYARARAPGRVGVMGEGLLGPTLIALRDRRAEGAVPAADPRRDRAVVPGLLRTRRRQRPGQRVDQGASATAGSGW